MRGYANQKWSGANYVQWEDTKRLLSLLIFLKVISAKNYYATDIITQYVERSIDRKVV